MCYLLLFPHHTQEIFAFFRGTLQRNWGQSICQVCLSSMMSIQVSKTEIILSTKVFSSFCMSQQCAYCLPCLLLKCLTCIYWMPSWCNYIRLWQGSHKLLISSLPGQDIHLSKSDPFRWHVLDKVNEEIWNVFTSSMRVQGEFFSAPLFLITQFKVNPKERLILYLSVSFSWLLNVVCSFKGDPELNIIF